MAASAWLAGVLTIVALIGPLAAAAITLLVIAFRGKPAWSAPLCGKCKYDLRGQNPEEVTACPECGADLTAPKAVHYLRGKGKRWGLAAWAVAIFLSPFVLGGLVVLVQVQGLRSGRMAGPGNYGSVPTQALIQQHLPQRVDEPWVYDELENRIQAGTLAASEADAALQVLIQHMKTTKPGGWDQPLSWQDDFVDQAHQAGLLSDAALIDLADAFFGPAAMKPFNRYREGQKPIEVELEYGNTWSSHGGMPLELVWQVTDIEVDGEAVKFREDTRHGERWRGYFEQGLSAGEHDLAVIIEAAYIDRQRLGGLSVSNLPAANWPSAKKRWKQQIKGKLKIYAEGDTLVKLSSDPALDPTGAIIVKQLVVQPYRRDQTRIRATLNLDDGFRGTVACTVKLKADEREVRLGSWWRHRYATANGSGSAGGGGTSEIIKEPLDPSVRKVDLILTPNPKLVDKRPDIDAIWGQPIVLKDVPIVRLDLPAEQQDGNGQGE